MECLPVRWWWAGQACERVFKHVTWPAAHAIHTCHVCLITCAGAGKVARLFLLPCKTHHVTAEPVGEGRSLPREEEEVCVRKGAQRPVGCCLPCCPNLSSTTEGMSTSVCLNKFCHAFIFQGKAMSGSCPGQLSGGEGVCGVVG